MKELTPVKRIVLSLQHLLAMFGATVLVPIQTGLDPGLSLICAGVGTLLFHSVTKGIVPVFLGSSFAFIAAINMTLATQGIGALKAGIIATGLVYIIMSFVVKCFGVDKVKSFFPPIVVGPIIMVIGLRLSPVAIKMSGYSYDPITKMGSVDPKSILIAGIVVLTMIIVSIFAKGFFKLVPILISIFVGYIAAGLLGSIQVEDIIKASWFGLSTKGMEYLTTFPEFSWEAIIGIAPIALVVFIEHIGDITTNGAVVGKNFFENPGIHRTLLGDGLATAVAGVLGGPANTTYGENTGVLAVTKVYDPKILRTAAVFAIILGLCGKVTAAIGSIPTPVMGGISIILFGMIASVGVRTLVDAKLDFTHSRNLIIAALIFVIGLSVDNIALVGSITISGLAVAALIGVVLNKVIPQDI